MHFLWYFRLSSYLFIGTGFFALLVTGYYGVLAALVFAGLIAAGWQVDAGRLRLPLSPLLWNILSVLFLGFTLVSVRVFQQPGVTALTNFIVFLQATKILTPKRHRDYGLIYLISFFELLISSIMTLSFAFALSSLLFVVTGTWALITLHLKGDIETYLLPAPAAPADFDSPALNGLLNGRFFFATFGITLVTCLLSGIIFVILPRMEEGSLLRYGSSLTPRMSGFSDQMDLGSFGAIRLDHTPVMRVELPGIESEAQLPPQVYWKGLAFSSFDGARWETAPEAQKFFPVQPQIEEQIWLAKPESTRNLLEQRIELTAPDYEVVFAMQTLYGIRGKFLSLQYDHFTGNTRVVYNPYAPVYTVFSDIRRPSDDQLRRAPRAYADDLRRVYLQLPDLPARIRTLAETLRQPDEAPLATIERMQTYLLENYTYSLNVARNPALLPLDDFLFEHRAGHCEYYATSLAVLLRLVGIPSRVVNGFARGRWNEYGQFFTVRRSDAHAWVEVYFPSYGWIPFDPTPPVAFGAEYRQFSEAPGTLARLYRYSEYLRAKWNRYVIDYSVTDQEYFVVETFRKSATTRRSVFRSLRQIRQELQRLAQQVTWRDVGMAAGSLLLLIFVIRIFRAYIPGLSFRWPRLTFAFRPRGQPGARFYQTMLRLLARKGFHKSPGATPGEFAQHIGKVAPGYGQSVQTLTRIYYRVRYGQHSPTGDDLRAIQSVLKQIKTHKRAAGQ